MECPTQKPAAELVVRKKAKTDSQTTDSSTEEPEKFLSTSKRSIPWCTVELSREHLP